MHQHKPQIKNRAWVHPRLNWNNRRWMLLQKNFRWVNASIHLYLLHRPSRAKFVVQFKEVYLRSFVLVLAFHSKHKIVNWTLPRDAYYSYSCALWAILISCRFLKCSSRIYVNCCLILVFLTRRYHKTLYLHCQ